MLCGQLLMEIDEPNLLKCRLFPYPLISHSLLIFIYIYIFFQLVFNSVPSPLPADLNCRYRTVNYPEKKKKSGYRLSFFLSFFLFFFSLSPSCPVSVKH